jgi:hypothetical protein
MFSAVALTPKYLSLNVDWNAKPETSPVQELGSYRRERLDPLLLS